MAELFVSGTAHRKLSHALLAKKLGAEGSKGVGARRLNGGVMSAAAEMSSFSRRRAQSNSDVLAGSSGNASPTRNTTPRAQRSTAVASPQAMARARASKAASGTPVFAADEAYVI